MLVERHGSAQHINGIIKYIVRDLLVVPTMQYGTVQLYIISQILFLGNQQNL